MCTEDETSLEDICQRAGSIASQPWHGMLINVINSEESYSFVAWNYLLNIFQCPRLYPSSKIGIMKEEAGWKIVYCIYPRQPFKHVYWCSSLWYQDHCLELLFCPFLQESKHKFLFDITFYYYISMKAMYAYSINFKLKVLQSPLHL